MPIFRPSCVVDVTLAFDEALTLQKDLSPAVLAQLIEEAPFRPVRQELSEPLILQRGDQNRSFVMARIPKTLTLEKGGYRQCGKFSMTLDYRDLPIDPRTIRSAGLEIHFGAVTHEDFAAGFRGREKDGSRRSVLRTRLANGDVNMRTLRLTGVADEWEVTFGDKSAEVKIEGRDLRGILIDTPIDAGLKGAANQFYENLDLSLDIQAVVLQILSWHPYFKDIPVVANAEDWPAGELPHPGDPDLVPRHRLGARGKRTSGRGNPNSSTSESKMSFWDAITRVCFLVGAIPYFVGGALHLRPAATVFDRLRGPIDPVRNPTPFRNGQERGVDQQSNSPITPALRVRRIVYGRDTKTMKFTRKLGGKKRPTVVRCIGWDPGNESTGLAKVPVGIWPPEEEVKARATRMSPNGQVSMEEVFNYPVPSVKDVPTLIQLARSMYEEMGRSELGGDVETKNLSSFGGDNADPDLLTLDVGDGVELIVDVRSISSGAPLVSAVTDLEREPFEQAVANIKALLGPDDNLARVIVATSRGQVQELQRFFRVANVKYVWNHTSGVDLSFDFENYVELRAQVAVASAKPGVATAKASTTTSKRNQQAPGSSIRSLNGGPGRGRFSGGQVE